MLRAGQGAVAQRITGAQAAHAPDQRIGKSRRSGTCSRRKTTIHTVRQPFTDTAAVVGNRGNAAPRGLDADQPIRLRPEAWDDEDVGVVEESDELGFLQPSGEAHVD